MASNKKNIALQTIYQIADLIIPFITAPYIARVLGAEQSGIYSYTYSIVNYFMLFAMLGIDYYGNRSIAAVRDDKEKLNKVFSEILVAHIFFAIIVLIVYAVFCCVSQEEYRVLFIIQGLFIVGQFLNINWLFAGLGEFKITVVRNLILKALTVIAIFILVKEQQDLWKYALIMSLGTAISTSAVWIVMPKYVSLVKVNIKNSLKHLKPLFVLYIAIMANSLMKLIDKTMLGLMGDMSELGCYEYAEKIMKMPLAVISAIGVVMISSSSNLIAKGNSNEANKIMVKSVEFTTIFCSLIVFGLFAYAIGFSEYYLGSEYALTGELLIILAISLLFNAWNDILRTQYYIPRQKDKLYIISIVVASILNIVLNILFIPLLGVKGASVSTVIAYLLITVLELFFARKDINLKYVILKCVPVFMMGVIPFALSYLWKFIFPENLLFFILQIVLFVLEFGTLFIGYLFITKQTSICKYLFKRKK